MTVHLNCSKNHLKFSTVKGRLKKDNISIFFPLDGKRHTNRSTFSLWLVNCLERGRATKNWHRKQYTLFIFFSSRLDNIFIDFSMVQISLLSQLSTVILCNCFWKTWEIAGWWKQKRLRIFHLHRRNNAWNYLKSHQIVGHCENRSFLLFHRQLFD